MDKNTVDKIRKLLALSKSSNPHEAEMALKKATELMQEHQITHAHLVPDPEVTHTDLMDLTAQHYVWARKLAQAVAKVFDCKVLWYPGDRTVQFIGEPGNLEATQAMFWHLFKAWKTMCNSDYKRDKPIDRKNYRKSHGLGFAEVLYDKATALTESRKSHIKNVTGKDLVVVHNQKVDSYMEATFKTRPCKTRSLTISSSGYSQGKEAGKKINLNQPVENTQRKKLT